MIETDRLVLRPWRAVDREPFAALCADPEVARWLGGPIGRARADQRIERWETLARADGFGHLAIERREDGAFLGYCGVQTPHESLRLPPGVEIGWGLARHAWGHGYATEAARAVLADGFDRLAFEEIWSWTAQVNLRSQAVMTRIGLVRDPARDFDHPNLPVDHPLSRHVFFYGRRSWFTSAPSCRSGSPSRPAPSRGPRRRPPRRPSRGPR